MRVLIEEVRDMGVRLRAVAVAIAAGTVALGSAVALAAVAAWLIARAAQMPSPAEIAVAAVMVRLFGITRGLFRYLERIASHQVALSGVATLRTRIYERLAGGGADRVLGLTRGEIVARMGADLDAVGDAIVRSIIPIGVAITVSLGAVVVVGSQLPVAGAALAACLLVAGLVPAALTLRAARIAATMGVLANAKVSVAALSAIESSTEHRVWGTATDTRAELNQANADAEAAHEAASRPAALAQGVQTLAAGLALLAGIYFAVTAIGSAQISGPAGAMVALTPLAAFEAVGAVPAAVMQYFRSAAAAARIRDLAGPPDNVPVDGVPIDAAPAPKPRTPCKDDPSVGRLEITKLSAAWPDMTPTNAVTVTAAPGTSLAITGRSGVGKTTLLLTIAGALAPASGTVRLAGRPVSDAHTGTVIAMTAEDAHLFGTTVLENLRVARGDATRTEAWEALATMRLDEWVRGLPDGLDTIIGSGGHSVSGGERRRLLLARALLSPAPVHLIDEPSEHLDEAGTAALRALLSQMRAAGRSVVIVTHDHTLLDAVDQVVGLD